MRRLWIAASLLFVALLAYLRPNYAKATVDKRGFGRQAMTARLRL